MFYRSLLEQNIIKKRRINDFLSILEFTAGNDKEYKVETIQNSTVYIKKADGYLSGLYHLVT